jgi:hypothetical protein
LFEAIVPNRRPFISTTTMMMTCWMMIHGSKRKCHGLMNVVLCHEQWMIEKRDCKEWCCWSELKMYN